MSAIRRHRDGSGPGNTHAVCGDTTADNGVVGGIAHTVRTAYKVWSGIAAGVFCLVAISDVSGSHATPTAAPVISGAASPAAVAPTARPVAEPVTTGTDRARGRAAGLGRAERDRQPR